MKQLWFGSPDATEKGLLGGYKRLKLGRDKILSLLLRGLLGGYKRLKLSFLVLRYIDASPFIRWL